VNRGRLAFRQMAMIAIGIAFAHASAANAAQTTGNPLRNAYFGDLHLHTGLSLDAYLGVGARVTPDEAYRFARGEPVAVMGQTLRRHWPLDFMAVTDHSEMMGVLNQLDDLNNPLSQSDLGRQLHGSDRQKLRAAVAAIKSGKVHIPGAEAAEQSAWQTEIDAANGNYRPGSFTTFIAYEWSSAPDNANLHRNVIFRGNSAPFPFTAMDSEKAEDLWTYLETNRARGVEALAIPHNANASNGLMFDWNDSRGRPIDQAYAQRRAMNEPLLEITQTKGQSDTHPTLSPNDEFSNFEILDFMAYQGRIPTDQRNIHGSYAREAYGRGLVLANRIGANPYKFGLEGGTDIHNGLSTSDENAFDGIIRGIDPDVNPPSADVLRANFNGEGISFGGLAGSGGLTGVWAEQNTRESIYDVLRRKETFATTGTRLHFRLFGGWTYARDTINRKDWLRDAYGLGVPMGGDLPAKPKGAKAPRFLVWAVKDPTSGNLDRAQIVKVWLNGDSYKEAVFDVAWTKGRKPDPKTGKIAPVGNTVDVNTAAYANTIGATELHAMWQDPQFDPKVPAVYYLRVLEIPTPRWSTLLAVRAGMPVPANLPATIQERGWSSPIWYTP